MPMCFCHERNETTSRFQVQETYCSPCRVVLAMPVITVFIVAINAKMKNYYDAKVEDNLYDG